MKTTESSAKPKANVVLVGKRGTITLPLEVRRSLGIEEGDVLPLQIKDGNLVFSLGAVLPIEVYSDSEIDEWVQADQLSASERKAAQKKLSSRSKKK